MLSGQLITNKFGLGDDATDTGMFHYNMALGDLGTLIFYQGWWYFQVVIYLVGRAPPKVGQSPTQSDFIEEGTFPKIHPHLSTEHT